MDHRVGTLRKDLLSLMGRKDHWAWPHFQEGRATRSQLLIHFQQEFAVYIRDFPILLSRVHSRCPFPEARRGLVENLYEEETGKLTRGTPHPELFLRMMEGFGFARSDFTGIPLIPEASDYRAWIDRVTTRRPWIEGAALVTIFIEGSVRERSYLEERNGKPPPDPENEVRNCPWVRFYGVDPRFLDLKRVHQMVETDHRKVAWEMVLDHVSSSKVTERLRKILAQTLDLWLLYRDGVARACRIPFPVHP